MQYDLKLDVVKKINIEIPDEVKEIGVLFSGGVDSTLLLSLIQLANKEKKFSITAFNIDNSNDYEFHCREILKNEFFKDIRFVASVDNGKVYDGIIRQGIANVLAQKDLDLVFIGINKNPDFEIKGSPVRRTAEELAPYKRLRYPFLDLTKDFIMKAYFEIPEIRDLDILKYTHSCTAKSKGQCGECFQCIERKWAFEKIGKTDPYIYKNKKD